MPVPENYSKEQEQADAWMGDAVLALFARRWILDVFGRVDGELQGLITSNQFLSRFGVPTAVEARIGRVLQAEGMGVALAFVKTWLLPEMCRHLVRQRPALSGYVGPYLRHGASNEGKIS